MDKPQVKIQLGSGGSLPEYKHPGDAGADVRASRGKLIAAGQTSVVPLSIRLGIPDGWEIQIRSRSGLAKKGIVVANSPGTIDSGYVGPVGVLLHNQSNEDFTIEEGDRIAQLVLKRAPQARFLLVDSLKETERGSDGFGSTGIK